MTNIPKPKSICPTCNCEIIQSGKGRPKEYHDLCGKFELYASKIEDIISELPKGNDTEKTVRGRLWNIANLANTLRKRRKQDDHI